MWGLTCSQSYEKMLNDMIRKEIPSIDKETAKTITTTVKLYFRNQGISHKEVAERLGYSSASVVDNHLSYGRFGKRMAAKWAKEFGFNEKFLLTGKGRLVERRSGYQKLVRENESLKAIIRIQKNMLQQKM